MVIHVWLMNICSILSKNEFSVNRIIITNHPVFLLKCTIIFISEARD